MRMLVRISYIRTKEKLEKRFQGKQWHARKKSGDFISRREGYLQPWWKHQARMVALSTMSEIKNTLSEIQIFRTKKMLTHWAKTMILSEYSLYTNRERKIFLSSRKRELYTVRKWKQCEFYGSAAVRVPLTDCHLFNQVLNYLLK